MTESRHNKAKARRMDLFKKEIMLIVGHFGSGKNTIIFNDLQDTRHLGAHVSTFFFRKMCSISRKHASIVRHFNEGRKNIIMPFSEILYNNVNLLTFSEIGILL